MHYIAARGAIDQVCSKFLELAVEFNRLLNIAAATHPSSRRNANKQWRSFWPRTLNSAAIARKIRVRFSNEPPCCQFASSLRIVGREVFDLRIVVTEHESPYRHVIRVLNF
jgi:hypothetical protein